MINISAIIKKIIIKNKNALIKLTNGYNCIIYDGTNIDEINKLAKWEIFLEPLKDDVEKEAELIYNCGRSIEVGYTGEPRLLPGKVFMTKYHKKIKYRSYVVCEKKEIEEYLP